MATGYLAVVPKTELSHDVALGGGAYEYNSGCDFLTGGGLPLRESMSQAPVERLDQCFLWPC